jgi:hypothetical protein
MALIRLSSLNQRRWQLFKANRRGFWSFWIFTVLFLISLFAPFLANDRPMLVSYKGELLFPTFVDYPQVPRSGEPGRDQRQWLDAVAADPLFLQYGEQRTSQPGALAAGLPPEPRRGLRQISGTGR